MSELVRPSTRREFVEQLSGWEGWPLRRISNLFEDEGVPLGDIDPGVSGERRSLATAYMNGLDWSSSADVRKGLNVFEHILMSVDDGCRSRLVALLDRDGYKVSEDSRISRKVSGPAVPHEALPTDAPGIEHQLERVRENLDGGDHAAVISAAKASVEAVLRYVCHELGEPAAETDDMSVLAKKAMKLLNLDVAAVPEDRKGAEAIKRIFRGLNEVTAGMAQLRNAYGLDHGRVGGPAPLGHRHAALAAGAAETLVRFVLATMDARKAR